MFRLLCPPACAVFAVAITPLFTLAQEAYDPFAPISSSADENPFGEWESASPSDTEQAVLTPALMDVLAGAAKSEGFCKRVGGSDTESMVKIEQALRRKLNSDGLEFDDTPLAEVAAFIQENYQVPVQFDKQALDEVGIDRGEPVTANLQGISLRSALRLLLDSLHLRYVVQNEVLLITTPEVAEAALTTCVYDVRDLRRRGHRNFDFNSLIDTIVSCIAPDTWAENGGGESDIRPLEPGFLVISQTTSVHEEICQLLDSIRELKGRPVTAAAGAGLNGSLDELVTEWNVRE